MCDRTGDNSIKMEESECRLNLKKKFFMVRVVEHRKKLLRKLVGTSTLEVLKVELNRYLVNLIY